MNLSRLLAYMPLILSVISALLSSVEVYTFDVGGYLTARLETWLLIVFVALYVYTASKYVLSHVKERWKLIIGVLSGGGAHIIGSAGGAVLWLIVDRLAQRTVFAGLSFGFSNISGEYSSYLLGILIALICSLIYLAWIPFLRLGAVVLSGLLGCYVSGLFEFNRLPGQLADQVVFISRRLREVRVGLPMFSSQEQVLLKQYWTEKGFQTFSDLGQGAVAPNLKQAFYWCLRDRMDCRFVANTTTSDFTAFPRSSLIVGTCEDLGDLSASQLLSHRGVISVSLGGKGRPCMVISTWREIDNLFPDLQELEVNEPREDLLRELPDHITSLSVRMKEITAGALEAIGRHRHLVNLKLSTQSLPESALFYLSNMESLHTLWLKGRGLSSDRLKGADLPSLRELTLGPGSSIALFDIRHLEGLNLERLEIFSDTLTKENVEKVVSQFSSPPKAVIVRRYESPILENRNLPGHLKEMLVQQMKNESEW